MSAFNYHRITEWVGKAPPESSRPTPCSKQDYPEQVAQGQIHSGFEYLQEWRQYSSSGEFISVADHPNPQKSLFSYVQMNIYLIAFYAYFLFLSLGMTEKKLKIAQAGNDLYDHQVQLLI